MAFEQMVVMTMQTIFWGVFLICCHMLKERQDFIDQSKFRIKRTQIGLCSMKIASFRNIFNICSRSLESFRNVK